MTEKLYRPGLRRGGRNQHSVSRRIEAFFRANPQAEMTIFEVAAKVYTVYSVAARELLALCRDGVLSRYKDGRIVIYRSAA